MKNLFSILCALTLCAVLLAGCGGSSTETADSAGSGDAAADAGTDAAGESTPEETPEEPDDETLPAADPIDINIAALKGPTAMGMVHFMDQADSGALTDNHYHFSIAAAIDEVNPKLAQGAVDIAAVPANVSSVLYNNSGGAFQVLAINTLGVLYVVESGETVSTVEDLRGKIIYATGKGSTPEYALNVILAGNGIDPSSDVTIEWKAEAAECLSALMAQENAIAMLPQPFVTTAQAKSDKIRVALNLTREWEALQEGGEAPSALVTGVVVARREFVERNPEAVSAFLDHYEASVEFVNNNTEAAAQLVGKYEIVTAEVAQKALPACNITFIEGSQMREKLSGYLAALLEQNPQSIGGALPGDDYYFSR